MFLSIDNIYCQLNPGSTQCNYQYIITITNMPATQKLILFLIYSTMYILF